MSEFVHVPITAGQVATHTFNKLYGEVGILHESGDDPIGIRIDGGTPVVLQNATATLLPGARRIFQFVHAAEASTAVVKVISASTASVELEVASD